MAFADPGTVNTSSVPLWSSTGIVDEFAKIVQVWWWVPVLVVVFLVILWAVKK